VRTPEMMQPEDNVPLQSGYYFPPYITLAHIFHAESEWILQRRKFSQYQLQYVIEGEAFYEIEGTTYHTSKGDLIIHYPEQYHSVQTVKGSPYVCISIVFHFGQSNYPLRNLLQDRNHLGNYQNEEIAILLSGIAAEYGAASLSETPLPQGLLLSLLAKLIRRGPLSSLISNKTSKTKAHIVKVHSHILAHYAEAIALEDLVRIAGYTRNHLVDQYKRQYGVTPFEHIRLLRAEKAKQLALQTNMSFGEIAQAVGYCDVHAFSKMFRKVTGTSLSRFCSALVINKPVVSNPHP